MILRDISTRSDIKANCPRISFYILQRKSINVCGMSTYVLQQQHPKRSGKSESISEPWKPFQVQIYWPRTISECQHTESSIKRICKLHLFHYGTNVWWYKYLYLGTLASILELDILVNLPNFEADLMLCFSHIRCNSLLQMFQHFISKQICHSQTKHRCEPFTFSSSVICLETQQSYVFSQHIPKKLVWRRN